MYVRKLILHWRYLAGHTGLRMHQNNNINDLSQLLILSGNKILQGTVEHYSRHIIIPLSPHWVQTPAVDSFYLL